MTLWNRMAPPPRSTRSARRSTREEIGHVEDTVCQLARADDWVVLSGRLPAGAANDTYATIRSSSDQRGVKVAVDTSGPALAESLAAGPTLIKPNRDELAEAFDGPINTFADVATAAESLRDKGAGAVLASLGGDGAMLADGNLCAATCPVSDRRSTVGAGDCLLAGFLQPELPASRPFSPQSNGRPPRWRFVEAACPRARKSRSGIQTSSPISMAGHCRS